jgi:hypothetical protein
MRTDGFFLDIFRSELEHWRFVAFHGTLRNASQAPLAATFNDRLALHASPRRMSDAG